MGLFQSIPKDVILTHIIPHLGYLDRVHLYSTCKDIRQKMKQHDPLSKAMITKDWTSALYRLVEWTSILNSFDCCYNITDFVCRIPSPFFHSDNMYINLALCTTKLCCISYFRLCIQDQTKHFDEEVTSHLYDEFNGNIPEEYFKVLTCSGSLCSVFARVGNYNLYKRFYDLYYTEEVSEDEPDDLRHIAFEAGMGGNPEICRHIFDDHGGDFGEHLFKGIAWSGNPKTLELLDTEERDIITCFQECMKYPSNIDQNFCSVPELNTTCKYLLENYPEVWEKIKLNKNKKQKITF